MCCFTLVRDHETLYYEKEPTKCTTAVRLVIKVRCCTTTSYLQPLLETSRHSSRILHNFIKRASEVPRCPFTAHVFCLFTVIRVSCVFCCVSPALKPIPHRTENLNTKTWAYQIGYAPYMEYYALNLAMCNAFLDIRIKIPRARYQVRMYRCPVLYTYQVYTPSNVRVDRITPTLLL